MRMTSVCFFSRLGCWFEGLLAVQYTVEARLSIFHEFCFCAWFIFFHFWMHLQVGGEVAGVRDGHIPNQKLKDNLLLFHQPKP